MAVDKFRFVSPGVQVAEIDRSGIPAEAPAVGPAVIGRSLYGPGMRPVRLESTADLYKVFGAPSPGGRTGDVWRDGNEAAPTYGMYAAEAYLRNNGPVTFVRLVGNEYPDLAADATGKAGWEATKAVGLYLAKATGPDDTNIDQFTASLAAVFYLYDQATASLASFTRGQDPDRGRYGVLCMNDISASGETNLDFTLVIDNYQGTNGLTASFNFDPNSEKYIRKVFNTNPHFTNDTVYAADTALSYFLGETFESSIAEQICDKEAGEGAPTTVPAGYRAFAFLNELNGNSVGLEDRSTPASVAKTGYIFSQDLTEQTGTFQPEDQQLLFRFAATDVRGAWDNENIKVSVANIKAPTNPTVNPYGTFDVFVRRASDTDNKLELIESFAGLNLNPNSNDYIARRIGDKYLSWNTDEKYYEEFGTYNNASNYVRVEMNDEVDNGSVNPSVLPFGYYGPTRTALTSALGGAGGAGPVSASLGAMPQFAGVVVTTGSTGAAATTTYGDTLAADFGIRVTGPSLVIRKSGSYGVSTPRKAFYGVNAQGTFARRDNGYGDYTVRMSADLSDAAMYGDGTTLPSGLEYSYIFTLDDISGSLVSGAVPNPVYVSGSRVGETSLRGTGSINLLLDYGINAFTLPMVGGTDGLDITEPEPFVNRILNDSTLTEQTSYEIYSVKKAIDILRDPDVIEHNVVTVPGVSAPVITDYLVEMAEERKDTIALIDIENDYKPRFELTSGEAATSRTRLPNVSSAVTSMRDRGFDTSYGAAYYPAVQIRDRGTNAVLYAPATVAALAAFGRTDNVAFPWFAPAGFNRGGLSDGSSGIVATGVSKRLTSKERDDLYAINVNPIAQFPQEGVVIFGQKTLQATPSALDRVNVRRLLIYVKKEISRIANSILFQPNVRDTWNQFLINARPVLDDVKAKFGLTDYRLILDETTTTPELIDRNILYARVLLKPTRAIEFIAVDFEIFRTGASFDD